MKGKNMSALNAEVNEAHFELLPGKVIDIQINHPVSLRLKTQLVGYDIGRYIILKHPAPTQMKSYKDVLVEGNVVIVRYLMEGNQGQCFAFQTTIRQVTTLPDKFMILEYPKSIENRELRMHERVVTHLPAKIMTEDQDSGKKGAVISGVIGDISAKGCGFAFKSKNENVKVNQRDVIVVISLPEKEVKINAKVRNSRYQSGRVNVGIQFLEDDKQVRQVLEHLFIE